MHSLDFQGFCKRYPKASESNEGLHIHNIPVCILISRKG